MKILHIHPAMHQGGIEAMITGLANQMATLGEDVSICSIFKPTSEAIFWSRLNPDVKKFDLGKNTTGFSIKEIFKVYKMIKYGRYDVVHIHGFFQYYALTVLLLHEKVKFYYTVHSDAFKESNRWDRKIIKFKTFCFHRGWVKPITISEASQESFTKLYQCPSTLIPNGVVKPQLTGERNIVDEVRVSLDTKVFVHPGRISEAKNQHVLIRVFDRLIKENRDIVLLIVGSNDDQKIFDRISPYFSERICYIGTRNDVPELLAKADGFCLPSIWEGLPITLLEALSVGCIPICSPVGGIVNVIHSGKNGILSLSSSEEDYYNAMLLFLNLTEKECKVMKKKCLLSFEPYNIEKTAQMYLKAYNTI